MLTNQELLLGLALSDRAQEIAIDAKRRSNLPFQKTKANKGIPHPQILHSVSNPLKTDGIQKPNPPQPEIVANRFRPIT